ncbi:MAG: GDP-mannose 4,6-dehydratase [Bdellovibrionales bacterium]|nr:GDP-mannose 4,6-dehydratase [Bdellovibrionales bacterium]
MKILIPGGAGFIGSHLCEHFLEQGHEVTAIDNVSTGSIENISHLVNHKKFQLIVDSILNVSALEPLIQQSDHICHLAAAVGVKLIVNDPVTTIETNIRGTEIMLHYANKWRKPVLFTSTSEVYGKNTNETFSENDDMVLGATTHSRWSYACSKAIDEFLVLSYFRKRQLPATIVRLFNTVGPRQSPQYGMVLPRFVKQALEKRPITVYGDGSQTRTFTYVNDVVLAISKLIETPKAIGEVFNIGGTEQISILELATLVKEKTKSQSEIVHLSFDEAYEPGFEDMKRRVPNIEKLKTFIDFHPTISLSSIVDNVIAYFKSNALK